MTSVAWLFPREDDASVVGEILDQIIYKMSKIPQTHDGIKCLGLTRAAYCEHCARIYGDGQYGVKLQISLARNK